MTASAPFGLLVLNKPPGISSRGALNHLQRVARPAKVGHAGTLDPLASGVLVACVGRATRLIEYVQQMPKRYRGTFLLGRTSPTEDTDGEVTHLSDPPVPTRTQLEQAATKLTGPILQRPPAYSALKVDGRRAYDLARRGAEVELKPRPIHVYRLEILAYEYPELVLDIECGSGTYVRSLGRDLAESVSSGAVMSALERTAIGSFCCDEGVRPDELTKDNWRQYLLPATRAIETLPRLVLDEEQLVHIHAGRTIGGEHCEEEGPEWAAMDSQGRLVAILKRRDEGRLGPKRNFPIDT